jgi:hypothetical protein
MKPFNSTKPNFGFPRAAGSNVTPGRCSNNRTSRTCKIQRAQLRIFGGDETYDSLECGFGLGGGGGIDAMQKREGFLSTYQEEMLSKGKMQLQLLRNKMAG